MVAEYQNKSGPLMNDFVQKITNTRTHPDFAPILAKYNLKPGLPPTPRQPPPRRPCHRAEEKVSVASGGGCCLAGASAARTQSGTWTAEGMAFRSHGSSLETRRDGQNVIRRRSEGEKRPGSTAAGAGKKSAS